MRVSSLSLAALAATLPSALAGLEDAKHSTKLTGKNFDHLTRVPEVGTLVAFFAPWCGHCKSLQGTWDKVAEAFETDANCRVGHLDADDKDNKPTASKFGVSGYPTLKFVKSDGSVVDYMGSRTEPALIDFLNKQCGTHRAPGGLLLPTAGRVASLDAIAAEFLSTPIPDRAALIAKAKSLTESLNDSMAGYYVKVMEKVMASEGYIIKEGDRLQKLGQRKGAVAGKSLNVALQLEELQIKQNILNAFAAAGVKIEKAAEEIQETVEEVIGKIKGEL